MKNSFLLWLRNNKEKITNPEKYVRTIGTISNDLSKKLSHEIDFFNIYDLYEAIRLRELYFSFNEFFEKNKTGHNMYSRAIDLYLEFLSLYKNNTQEIEDTLSSKKLTITEKENIILSRIGQGVFRKDLIKIWNGCCAISGVSQQSLLIASHVKPWKVSNNEERIDKYNGLLLLPTYDKLFDLGFISFHDNGTIIKSNKIIDPKKLNISDNITIKLCPQNFKYLEYHRNHVFSND